MLRVVVDTSVIVAALRTRQGAGAAVLRAVADRRIQALASPALFLEYEDVLKRPEHLLASGYSRDRIDAVLDALAGLIEPVEVHFAWRPQLRDASDELVLEAAVNGRADALVTYNIRDFVAAAPRFDLSVLAPADLLKELAS